MVSDKLKGKQGISLPLAMAIISVLIILSASLIAIAGTSVMSTSSSVNSRQAYLNVRSALEYAYAYYGNSSNVDDLSTVDGQYMIMDDDWFHNEASGSGQKGARIGTEAQAAAANTFVVAHYIKAVNTGDPAMLKLTAYSRSTDAFGNRSETVHMSAAYVINSGSAKNRVTMTDIDMDTTVLSRNEQRDAITLHAKQYPGQDWTPFFYLWTYKDVSGMYTNETTCYDVEKKYKFASRDDPDYPGDSAAEQNAKNAVAKIDKNEKSANSRAPISEWNVKHNADGSVNTTDPENGTTSAFTKTDDGWFKATYYYDKENVNYFNLIITKKGKVMASVYRGGTSMKVAEGVQSNEMFHLWFLTNNDKNIYFEFLKPGLAYRMKTDWNGTDYLDDRYLVYVMNQKTTIHFRAKGIDDNNVTTETKNPEISYVLVGNSSIFSTSNDYLTQGLSFSRFAASADSNYELWGSKTPYYYSEEVPPAASGANRNEFKKMMYEGCGWWVANIPVGETFTMNLTYYKDQARAGGGLVTVDPNRTTKEAYLVADPATTGDIMSRRTEAIACDRIGVDMSEYSTIRYKSCDVGSVIAPRLDYTDGQTSLTSRRLLHEKIIEVTLGYVRDDYTDDSFDKLVEAKDEGITLYNQYNYVSQQKAAGRTIEEIDQDYKNAIKKIDDAVKGLRTKTAEANTIKEFSDTIKEAEALIQDQEKNHTYDNDTFTTFVADGSPYKIAKEHDGKLIAEQLSTTEIYAMITALQNSIAELKNHALDRDELNTLLEEADKYKANVRYLMDARQMLILVIDGTKDYSAEEQAEAMDMMLSEFGLTEETGDSELFRRGANELKTGIASQDLINRECVVLEAAINYVKANASDPELKDALDAIYTLIFQVDKFIKAKTNTTSELLDELQTAYDAAVEAHKNAGTVTEINNAKDALQKAYDEAVVIKPDGKLSNNSKTRTELDSERKTRVWFSGFSDNGIINRYKGTDNEWHSAVYKVKGFTIKECNKSGNELGTSVDSSLLTNVSVRKETDSTGHEVNVDYGQNLSYYDFNDTTKGVILMVEIDIYELTWDEVNLKYVPTYIETTPPFFSHFVPVNSGTVICFDYLYYKNEGQTGPSGNVQTIVSNNLEVNTGLLSEYYLDAPTGATLEVYDPSKSVTVYKALPEGNSTKTYQVVRFVSGSDQTFIAKYFDSTLNAYVNSGEHEVTNGKTVVKFDTKETTAYTGKKVSVEFDYNDQESYYYVNSSYRTATGTATVLNPSEMTLVVKYSNGEEHNITPVYQGGRKYSADFVYENGCQFYLKHKAEFTYQTYDYSAGLTTKTETKDHTTNAVSITSGGTYKLTMASGDRISAEKKTETYANVSCASKAIDSGEILVNGVTTSSSTNTSAAAVTVPTLVSDNILSSVVTAPAATSAKIAYEATFDYFGQQGREVTPVVHLGQTVIWVDGNIKIDDDSGSSICIKDISTPEGVTPISIHVWGNGVDLVGTDAHHEQMYRVENSNYYYMVVDSTARGCTIVRNDTGKKINNNINDSHNFHFDATSIWSVGNRCGSCGRYYFAAPSGSKIVGQGMCEPYIIIDQTVYDGYNRIKNGSPAYYSLVVDNYHSNTWSRDRSGHDYTVVDSNTFYDGHRIYYYKYRARHQIKPPTYTVEIDEVDRSNMTATDLRMAFVGGSKLRMVNESFYGTYGAQYNRLGGGTSWSPYLENMKNSRNDMWIGKGGTTSGRTHSLFGGAGGSGGNNDSDGRVGDARLYIVYDWYEYKIPVDQDNTYTFQLSGVQYNSANASKNMVWTNKDYYCDKNRYTSQIANAYGNVWLVMNDTLIEAGDDNRYQHMTIYTQDPEEIQVEENQTIYFTRPSGDWTNIRLTCIGVGGQEQKNFESVGGNIFKVTVPASKPFLTIEADYKDSNGNDATFYCRTSLQGNDDIMFLPTLNGGTGGWDTYVPPEVQVRRALYSAQGLYYSYVLPVEVGSDFKVKKQSGDTYYFPKALRSNILDNRFDADGNVSSTSISVATVNAWVSSYKHLYETISKAKSYLGTRVNGVAGPYIDRSGGVHYYEEFYHNHTPNIYDEDTLAELYNALVTAENAYKSNGGSDYASTTIERAAKNLEDAINNVTLSTSNMIAFIYYDTQGFVARGCKFQLQYKESKDGSYTAPIDITYHNTDNCPILFLAKNQVYDVRFLIDGKPAEKTLDEATILDGAWVYMGISSNPHWVKNSVADYHQINVSEFNSSTNSNHIFKMKEQKTDVNTAVPIVKTLSGARADSRKYQPITLYFKKDTKVTYSANSLIVNLHFLNNSGDYTGYNVWAWSQGNNDGAQYSFDNQITSNGITATIPVTDAMKASKLGFIVRKGSDWSRKVNANDLFVDVSGYNSGTIDVYFKESKSDRFTSSTMNASTATSPVKTYTIRAGAYSFVKSQTGVPVKNASDVYEDTDTASFKDSPFVYANPSSGNKDGSGAWVIQCDLFSERAETYFTNPYSYNKLISNASTGYVAVNAEEDAALNTSWLTVNGDKLTVLPGAHSGGSKNINLTLNSGGFVAGRRHSYSTSEDLYFRWEGNTDLKVNDTVTFSAKKIVFASSGVVDVTGNYNKQFYFVEQSQKDSMTVIFATDVHVKYYDNFKELHEFTIREGEYIIHKANAGQSYVASLCDEEYWTTLEHVEVQNRYDADGGFNGGDSTGSKGRLSNPIYG